ncbi:ferric reduction oxidase 2-like isoform X2 [Benincasa hispida]|uniref:ferric reduction oxidase 2-like isoform X2 n=1 Tax=Benincasa hispida TaxID=102211 RepID=UPI001901734A|nr:ferric reduction oxidase 2-like isoform X2 [Benincasa hispida]
MDSERVLNLAIRVLVFILFMGWIFLWVMMPTNTYRQKWLHKIREKSYYSTYFGSEGTSLLMYTFPILFIAILGCVYVHLERKHEDRNVGTRKGKNHHGLAIWKQPAIVKGPLGIVSWTELALLAMFMALLVWSFATYLHNSFVKITPTSAAMDGEKVWESRSGSAGFWLGIVGNICLVFLFFPVARGSSLLPLLGLTSEGCIKYHIWLGHMTMAFFSAHGICFVIYWAATNNLSQMLKWAKTDVSNIAGELALVFGLIMWATTFPRIRRKFFEVFLYTHYLYILFIVFFIFHVGISYACIMFPGFYLFVIDRYLRFLQSRRRVRLLSARLLPCQALELNFSKHQGLKYNPTSTMFINIPSISKLQWHPFTITSHSDLEPETLSIVIKCEGTWSSKLYKTLSSSSSSTIDDHLQVSLEGPYGPASTSFLQFDTLLMISGGSGITPFISIIKHLIHNSKSHHQIPKLLLISAFKNTSDLTFLHLIQISDAATTLQDFQIEAYVTREKSPKNENPQIRSVIFKSHVGDSAAAAILGPNGWVWLAGVISSSFGIFLILIGVLNRYYIYPIDGNTNDVFDLGLRSFLHMLMVCFCIFTAATVAVIWNKRRVAKEGRQIQSVEGATPNASPCAMGFEREMELESSPFQALAQSVNVHYGERPNLSRILLGCKGESIGVLASGPKKLRQEVAAICSSGLSQNLHFHSISFTW